MRGKDEINERRRQRIRARKRKEFEQYIDWALDDAERVDMKKRLAMHDDGDAVDFSQLPTCRTCGTMAQEAGSSDAACPNCGTQEAYIMHVDKPPARFSRLARWFIERLGWLSFWWERKWRRLFPSKQKRKPFKEYHEDRALISWEKRKQNLLNKPKEEDADGPS